VNEVNYAFVNSIFALLFFCQKMLKRIEKLSLESDSHHDLSKINRHYYEYKIKSKTSRVNDEKR